MELPKLNQLTSHLYTPHNTGYRVEKKTPYGDWEAVSDTPLLGETATVPDLREGEEYQFRVAAVTDAGVGDFSLATAPIKAEKPKS